MKMNKTAITALWHNNSDEILTNAQPQCLLTCMCTYSTSNVIKQFKVETIYSSIMSPYFTPMLSFFSPDSIDPLQCVFLYNETHKRNIKEQTFAQRKSTNLPCKHVQKRKVAQDAHTYARSRIQEIKLTHTRNSNTGKIEKVRSKHKHTHTLLCYAYIEALRSVKDKQV